MSESRPPTPALSAGQPSAAGSHVPCAFCLEPVRLGALVCRHCGNLLAPIQQLASAQASLEARLSALEAALAAQAAVAGSSPTRLADPDGTAAEGGADGETRPRRHRFHWPHMA